MKGLDFWDVLAAPDFPKSMTEYYVPRERRDSARDAVRKLLRRSRRVRHIAFATDDTKPWWYEGEIVLLDNMHVLYGRRAARYDKQGRAQPFDYTFAILMPGIESSELKPSDYHIVVEALNWMVRGNN